MSAERERISDEKLERMLACYPFIEPESAGLDVRDALLDLRDCRAALAASRAREVALREALSRAHGCATMNDDGTCGGCYVSDALAGSADAEAWLREHDAAVRRAVDIEWKEQTELLSAATTTGVAIPGFVLALMARMDARRFIAEPPQEKETTT